MEPISKLLEKYKENEKSPPHEKAASVNEILKIVPETKLYNFGYWLRKVGKVKYGQILAVCKEAKGLEKKYNKGGFITNQLKMLNGTQTTK